MAVFGNLAQLRQRPIPHQAKVLSLKAGYRHHALDLSNPCANEQLQEARKQGLLGENHYAADRNPPHYQPIEGAIPELWVRESVAGRLVSADRRLAIVGLRLWLFDAWRPTAVQSYFHDVWMPNAIRVRRPDLSEEKVREEVETYWAAPTLDRSAPSPHLTGGAVDLTLCWADTKAHLWMGSLFDDVSALAHLDRFEAGSGEALAISDEEARANRRLLYWVMTEAGFSANPSEWWHFSYGDQMWARLTGQASGFYGAAEPPGWPSAQAAAE